MLDIDDTFKISFLPDHLNQVRVLSISDPFHEHMLNFICYYNDWKKPIRNAGFGALFWLSKPQITQSYIIKKILFV